MESRKQAIIEALHAFIRQRPGMDPRNYDRAGYRSESRAVTMDRHHAETLLDAVKWRDGITADMLLEAARSAYSGRLTFVEWLPHKDYPERGWLRPVAPDKYAVSVDYCTGQYFATEYRKAVAAVCASALWDYARANMPPASGYRVESWSQLGKGRTRHNIRETRAEAEADLEKLGGRDYGSVRELYARPDQLLVSAGEWLRAHFRAGFGRTIAARYFS